MPTVVARVVLESSEALARRVLSRSYASWSASSYAREVVSLAPGQSTVLPSSATLIVEADSVASVTLSWTASGVACTLPLSGLAVISPGAAVTITNNAAAGTNPVPVSVSYFS